ncbi:MAG: 4Fe-4S binding protein [Victivallaceae bacterium]|nr:ATP-binding protein [Victivallaceae bacterium]
MKIAVASGKGGTGKTTVALALAAVAEPEVRLLDCDVEEPNCRLFVRGGSTREAVEVPMPVVDGSLCTGCGHCGEACRFNAVAVVGNTVLLFPELCHGCGLCVDVCPSGALSEQSRTIGEIEISCDGDFLLVDGRLTVGQSMSPPLIRAVKKYGADHDGTTIIDCPPGTSCSMVAAVRGADYVILVTEPTPFGLHDLTLAVETLRELSIPFAVVINRADGGDGRVRDYCAAEKIDVLLEIPDRREVAEAYSRGETLLTAAPDLRDGFCRLLAAVKAAVERSTE